MSITVTRRADMAADTTVEAVCLQLAILNHNQEAENEVGVELVLRFSVSPSRTYLHQQGHAS